MHFRSQHQHRNLACFRSGVILSYVSGFNPYPSSYWTSHPDAMMAIGQRHSLFPTSFVLHSNRFDYSPPALVCTRAKYRIYQVIWQSFFEVPLSALALNANLGLTCTPKELCLCIYKLETYIPVLLPFGYSASTSFHCSQLTKLPIVICRLTIFAFLSS